MITISAKNLNHKALGEKIKAAASDDITVHDCAGQRFIAGGLRCKTLTLRGTPGNALGAYFDGGVIYVGGNAQDAVGDTMNDGKIVIDGNAGDALGYAMRGGGIFVRGNSGYRTGIHMKEYEGKKPSIVIGGRAGSFLGEYLAGGLIVVLGMGCSDVPVGNFTGTGMHGGRIIIRSPKPPANLPAQVTMQAAEPGDIDEITPLLSEFAGYFGLDLSQLLRGEYYALKPNTQNPYEQLYTAN
ncbi:MAG: glutamate synthase [Oscillospiraceae bacterium]|jgi:glutamate synthase domain-containing protein 3|nr:glutamate synthase [Oscillospiraceae bacterium]